MKVPTSEITSAISRLRNVGDRRGRHKLAEPSLIDIATAIHQECRGDTIHFDRNRHESSVQTALAVRHDRREKRQEKRECTLGHSCHDCLLMLSSPAAGSSRSGYDAVSGFCGDCDSGGRPRRSRHRSNRMHRSVFG
jgi:hypothetical protein